jgi:cytochrome b561
MNETHTTGRPTFSAPAKFFHWTTVLLLIIQYSIGWLMPNVGRATQPVGLVGLHLSVGALVVLLVLGRIAWRAAHPMPPDATLSPVLRTVAGVTHWLLYGVLIAFPLMGWANASSRGWPVSLFHVVPLPPLVATGSSFGHGLGGVHIATTWVLIALMALHVTGALYHHFVFRDDTLRRMLPGKGGQLRLLGGRVGKGAPESP